MSIYNARSDMFSFGDPDEIEQRYRDELKLEKREKEIYKSPETGRNSPKAKEPELASSLPNSSTPVGWRMRLSADHARVEVSHSKNNLLTSLESERADTAGKISFHNIILPQ